MQQVALGETTGTEKRRHLRVPIAAAAIVHKDNACLGRFWMVNLSVSGALIAGDMPVSLGEKVGLRLELGAHQSVRVRATVVRLGDGSPRPTVGFAFDHEADQEQGVHVRQSIANAVAGALKNDPRLVLIVDDGVHSRRELKFQIRCLGWACVMVRTPLEAIAALTESHQFACVLVGLTDRPAVAADLLKYFAEAHPRLGRLRISELDGLRGRPEPAAEPITARSWYSSALARALGI